MRSKTLKRITFLGVLLLVLAVTVVILSPSPNRYEISIYQAYPAYLWMFVVGALAVGAVVTMISGITPGDRTWVFSVPLMLMTNGLLLLIPYIRGYQMYGRADAMTHLGFVLDIVNSGSVEGNIYPPTHLLTLAVVEATQASPAAVSMLVTIVFSAIYFGGMCYVLSHLFESREQILMGVPFVLLPVLAGRHLGFRPYDLSVMLLPLTVYLFLKEQRTPTLSVRMTFVIGLVALLFYHPLTAVFVVGVCSVYYLSKYMPSVDRVYDRPTNVLSLSAAVTLAWYSLFVGVIQQINQTYITLFGPETGEPPITDYSETVRESSPPLIDLARVIAFKYGTEFVLFGLGFLFIGAAVWLVLRRNERLDIYTVVLMGVTMVFSLGGLLFLITDLIVPPQRPFMIAKIAAAILAGRLYYLIIRQVEWDDINPSLRIGSHLSLGGLLVLLILLSTFSLYQSPLAFNSNVQVTEMEVEGTEWLSEKGNPVNPPLEFGINYRRFHDATYGTRTSDAPPGVVPPPHFNYTEHESLGQSYTTDRYLMITRKGRMVYPRVFPQYREDWPFTPADFQRLERDETVSRIYDNGDYTQYRVNSTTGTGN